MLQLRSVCDVADNTGAKRAAIIHVLGEAKRYGEVGDVVKAHIKEAAPDGSVKKSEVVDAVVVRTRRAIRKRRRASSRDSRKRRGAFDDKREERQRR